MITVLLTNRLATWGDAGLVVLLVQRVKATNSRERRDETANGQIGS